NDSSMRRASSAEMAMTPTVSRVHDRSATPAREIRPRVVFSPTTPQQEAGMRTLPPVSVPRLPWTIPAATAAAEPPDDPPAIRAGFFGFLVCGVRTPYARGWLERVPRMVAPAETTLDTTDASARWG